ncbi:HNH endonuclease family protein [Streptomyces sp. HNM0574]|uniref:HNH endonuclease family protein n=1 Tax=Streptomyces sp. HNM0574 TaxID=2714954 RepID=UPI0019D0BE62|nr:HNH endonuclease family protein [Streptomyces sp. HNM0574]
MAAALALTGCEVPGGEGSPGGGSASGGASPGASAASGAVNPLDNPDGTEPGLAPLTSEADRAEARALIDGLGTRSARAGSGADGYARDAFGYAWKDTVDGVPLGRNGCDTRNDMLARDGRDLRHRSGSDCVVESMTLHDPYTGTEIDWRKAKAAEVQIDHVVPLSYGWRMGASRWTDERRQQLANDPLNLLPSEGSANAAKGDSGPADWLPPDRGIRCAYVVRFAQVAEKYRLPVTDADQRAMRGECAA